MNPNINVVWIPLNLLDNESIHAAADAIKELEVERIHVVINNAGVMGVRNYATSKQGVESQFAANYLGHFLLTNLLMDQIIPAKEEDAVIVNVGSLGYELGEVNLDDINFEACRPVSFPIVKNCRLMDLGNREGKIIMLGRHLDNRRPRCFSGTSL